MYRLYKADVQRLFAVYIGYLQLSTMGNSIAAARTQALAADQAEKAKMQEQLQILEKMLTSHLSKEMTDILAGERNDQEIHTGTVVQFHQQINIKMSSKEDQKISDSIHDFFSGDIMGGLEDLIEVGAQEVLGNSCMGEYETSDMFIVWNSNALLRCDAYYYRWNFSAKGVIDEAEGCVGVLLVKRVINVTKTDPQVLCWAISEQAARTKPPGNADAMIASALKTLETVIEFQKKFQTKEIDRTETASSAE